MESAELRMPVDGVHGHLVSLALPYKMQDPTHYKTHSALLHVSFRTSQGFLVVECQMCIARSAPRSPLPDSHPAPNQCLHPSLIISDLSRTFNGDAQALFVQQSGCNEVICVICGQLRQQQQKGQLRLLLVGCSCARAA